MKCNICEKEFGQERSLKLHIKTQHEQLGKRNVTCPSCDYATNHEHYLKRHIKDVHLNGKKFTCDQCSHISRNSGSMQKHILRHHKKDRSFICMPCGKAFGIRSDLMQHENKVHTCGCGKCFVTPQGEVRHKCDYCSKVLARASIRKHMKSQHGSLITTNEMNR